MKLKWGKEKVKGFSNSLKKAEEFSDWAWWALLGAVIVMGILLILKLYGKM